MADEKNDNGAPDTSQWVERPAVTNRPNDLPIEDEKPASNSTFGDRAKAGSNAQGKQVATAENKAVTVDESKAPAKTVRRSTKK